MLGPAPLKLRNEHITSNWFNLYEKQSVKMTIPKSNYSFDL